MGVTNEPLTSSAKLAWAEQRVLVTGATGMLGLSVVAELRRRHAWITAASRSGADVASADESVAVDVEDDGSLAGLFDGAAFDVVLHLAGQSQDTGAAPKSTFDTNLSGTLNLLEAVRNTETHPAIVLASTCAVDARWRQLLDRNSAAGAVRPYEASKMCAEIVARCYRDSYGLAVGLVRLPNLFGPGDRNLRRLVPGTVCAVLKGEAPVIRSDLSTPLNFMYVDDASIALLELAERVALGCVDRLAVAVRNDESTTLGEMVRAILARMDRLDLCADEQAPAASSSASKRTAATLAEDTEEWLRTPRLSLDEALDRTIDWYRRTWIA